MNTLESRIENLEQRVTMLETKLTTEPSMSVASKQIAPKEFLLSKKPDSDVEKTVFLGYYLEKYKQYGSFNKKDIEIAYRLAKESLPQNISDKISKAITRGFFTKAQENKDGMAAWCVTTTGERFVENHTI